jgi:hypothetical protein
MTGCLWNLEIGFVPLELITMFEVLYIKTIRWQLTEMTDIRDDEIPPRWVSFHLHVGTFKQHLHIKYIYLSSYDNGSNKDFIDKGLLLPRKILNQGFLLANMKSSRRTFSGRHYDLVCPAYFYFYQILPIFNKLKIMSNVTNNNWKKAKTIYMFH